MEIRRKKGLNKSRIVGHNKVVGWIIIVLTAILILLLIFIKTSPEDNGLNVSDVGNETQSTNTQLANPAAVYCLENNGNLSIRTDANGGQYGVCILSSGKECDEWKHYRGEC